MAEDTIPKAIRYKFLEKAQRVCDLAKVDYWEHSEVLSSLREQLEASYRAYDEAGLYKDDAEAKALKDFGSVDDVARLHRDGFRGLWHRLLFSQRYSIHRMFVPVLFGMFHCALRMSDSLEVTTYHNKIVPFAWNYYLGVIIIAATVVSRRTSAYFHLPTESGQSFATTTAVWIFAIIAKEWITSMHDWLTARYTAGIITSWYDSLVTLIYLWGHLIEAAAFLITFVLAMAEILEVPACHQAVIEGRRRGNLERVRHWFRSVDHLFERIDDWCQRSASFVEEKLLRR